MKTSEIAVLVSTFERPFHLRRSLVSIAGQRGVEGKMEVVVTDDGSRDETWEVVEEFARHARFPLTFTTHQHDGFRLARCRNEGVLCTAAPYLLFTDGDCLLPPDHVSTHLEFRRRGIAVAGESYRLDRPTSERITEPVVRSGEFAQWVPRRERSRLANKARRAWIYSLLRLRNRPRLTGSNIGVWRDDFERINGFDENYVGWGLEDRDLQLRLGQLGVRFRSILGRTAAYHLWHPRHPTFARNNEGTANLRYHERPDVEIYCRKGLVNDQREVRPWKPAVEAVLGVDILPFPSFASSAGTADSAWRSRAAA